MTLIQLYPTIEEASIVQGMLHSYGIEAEISPNNYINVFPAPDCNAGPFGVYVPEADEQKAKDLLRQHGDC